MRDLRRVGGLDAVPSLRPAASEPFADMIRQARTRRRQGVRVELTERDRDVLLAPDLELARCLSDWELREELGLGELAVIPDLFALVRLQGHLVPVAVEVDCGTESASVLRSKVERYAALWGRSPGLFGWERFALLIVLHGRQRRAIVDVALKKVWVLPAAIACAHEPVSCALLPLLPHLQLPLSDPPYRQGSPQGESAEPLEGGRQP